MALNNQYTAMKERHQKEVNDFPFFFAFSNEQFASGMRSKGLEPNETDKIYKFGATGGYYLRTDAARLREMCDRHEAERNAALEGDKTGDGYIFDMFKYELENHEYTYTRDFEDTLDALDITPEDIAADPRLAHGLQKAAKTLRDAFEAS